MKIIGSRIGIAGIIGRHTVRAQVVQPPGAASDLYIYHEAIDDWVSRDGKMEGMDAMAMSYPVARGVPLAGIQANDIIEEVGGKTVSDVAEFGRLLRLARTNKKPAILLVNRNGNTTFYSLRLTS